jgi:hypothetical protein
MTITRYTTKNIIPDIYVSPLTNITYFKMRHLPDGKVDWQRYDSLQKPHLPALRWRYIVKPAIKARVFTTKPTKVHEEILIK